MIHSGKFSVTGMAKTLIKTVRRLVDARDVLYFGGLSMLGYGLYLQAPWISFSVCGLILLLSGLFMRGD